MNEHASGEVKAVDASGGAKGVKPARHSLIPPWFLDALATLFGQGATKYGFPDGRPRIGPDEQNWALGYRWSYSVDAMNRHLQDWRKGETETPQNPPGEPQDPTAGTHPLVAVAWHCCVLYCMERFGLGQDDRWLPERKSAAAAGAVAKPGAIVKPPPPPPRECWTCANGDLPSTEYPCSDCHELWTPEK